MSWSGRISLRRGEIAVAVVLVLFAGGIIWGALQMPRGTLGAPGPGFFPGVLGGLLLAASVILLVRAARLPPGDDAAVDLGHRDIAITVLSLAGLSVIFEIAGYVLSATLFMLVLLRAFSTLGWLRSLVAAVVTAVVSYVAFVRVLGVSLPGGLMPFS